MTKRISTLIGGRSVSLESVRLYEELTEDTDVCADNHR